MKLNGRELGEQTSKKIAELLKNSETSPEKKEFIQHCIKQKRAGRNIKLIISDKLPVSEEKYRLLEEFYDKEDGKE